jgi:hypothetical protein
MLVVLITTMYQLTVAAVVVAQVLWVLRVLHLKQEMAGRVHLAVLVVQQSLMLVAVALVLITAQPLAQVVQVVVVTVQTQQLVLQVQRILAAVGVEVHTRQTQRVVQAVRGYLFFPTLAHKEAQAVHIPQSVDIQSTHLHLAVHLQLN